MDAEMIRRAIAVARAAQHAGEPPFGALVVDPSGHIYAEASDEVRLRVDFTQHAEVNAVRRACQSRGRSYLSGLTLYTTVEPCPMCFTAAWLSRISRVVFGTSMEAVRDVTLGAQRELLISAERMNELSGAPLELVGGVLAEECLAPFGEQQHVGL